MKKKFFLHYAAIAASVVLGACSGAEYINLETDRDDIKTLEVVPFVSDGQGESTGSFTEEAVVDFTGDGIDVKRFTPTAYVNVVLEKKHINVSAEADIAVVLTNEETVSDNGVDDGVNYGKDIVKKFTFSDGQVATVSYGWRYEKIAVANTTISAPHLEIHSMVYDGNTSVPSGENHKVTLAFNASWAAKSVTMPQTGVMTLKPWYTKAVVVGDVVGDPVWDFKLNWRTNDERQGIADVVVTKTIPHSLEADEVTTWSDQVIAIMGLNRDNHWYVANTEVSYDTSVADEDPGSRTGGTDNAFKVEYTSKRYNFTPYYRMPGGGYLTPEPVFNTLVRSARIVFDNGEKRHEFNVPLELRFSQSVKYLDERAKLYPNDTYLGSDVKEFSFVNTATNEEVMHHTTYTDLKLHP